jgi:hypothetical protein
LLDRDLLLLSGQREVSGRRLPGLVVKSVNLGLSSLWRDRERERERERESNKGEKY